ncbi:MAG: hypothetical protein QE263_02245 [Vampirovibrionales bacterium]|nr:hypothetical protein [Vampirovibrionales bacterium]
MLLSLPLSAIYGVSLALNKTSDISYTLRDAYRNETSVPESRYIDYALIGYLGTFVSATVIELAIRISEALYSNRVVAQRALQLHRLNEWYHQPGSKLAAHPIGSLGKVPDLISRVSGSLGERKDFRTLSGGILGPALRQNAHQLGTNPTLAGLAKQAPAWLQLLRRTNYALIGNENLKEAGKFIQHDYLGVMVQEDTHVPELYKMLQPHKAPTVNDLLTPGLQKHFSESLGQYRLLTKEHANLVRHAIEEYELTYKFFDNILEEPPKKWVLWGNIKKTDPKKNIYRVVDKLKATLEANPKAWIENPGIVLDKTKNDGIFRKFFMDFFESRDFIDKKKKGVEAKEVDYRLLSEHLDPKSRETIQRVLKHVQELLGDKELGLTAHGRPGDPLPDKVLTRLFERVSQRFETAAPKGTDLRKWLNTYLHDGMVSHQAKKTISSVYRSQFWLTMVAGIAVNFFAYGMLPFIQMNWAIPLQKKLLGQGINPKDMMQGPMYLAPLPGIAVYTILMHQKINRHLGGLGKAFLSLGRVARHTVAGVLGLGITAAGLAWGLNRNIKNKQAQLKQQHPTWGQKVIPTGMQEVRLNPYAFQHFAQTAAVSPANPFESAPLQ